MINPCLLMQGSSSGCAGPNKHTNKQQLTFGSIQTANQQLLSNQRLKLSGMACETFCSALVFPSPTPHTHIYTLFENSLHLASSCSPCRHLNFKISSTLVMERWNPAGMELCQEGRGMEWCWEGEGRRALAPIKCIPKRHCSTCDGDDYTHFLFRWFLCPNSHMTCMVPVMPMGELALLNVQNS